MGRKDSIFDSRWNTNYLAPNRSTIWRYISPLFHVVNDFCSDVLVKRFAEHGYDMDETWKQDPFPVMTHCCTGATSGSRMEMFALLLLELGANPNGRIYGITGLQSTVKRHNETLFHKLLEHPKIDLDKGDSSGRTALHYLVQYGTAVEFSVFLNRTGFNINAQDATGFTPLHLAAARQHVKSMEILLNVPGIRLDSTDNNGRTALTVATYWGHTDIAYALIQNTSAFPTPEPGQLSSLVCAAIHQDKSLTFALLEKYAYTNLDVHIDFSGKGVLYHAASNDWPGVLESCLCQGPEIISVNKIDRSGATALHRTAAYGNVASCQVLLKHGASVRFQDRNGRTAAHAAADSGFKDALMLLLQAPDIDVTQKDHQGRNLVHWAASLDWLDVVKTVLEKPAAGLCLIRKDNLGKTPIDIAYSCRCPLVGKFLEDEMKRRGAYIYPYSWDSLFDTSIITEVEDESSYELRGPLSTREGYVQWQWTAEREEIRRRYPEELWALTYKEKGT